MQARSSRGSKKIRLIILRSLSMCEVNAFSPMSKQPAPATILSTSAPEAANVPVCLGEIWIDLDNTPHVPFFKPIIRELERAGFSVLLTARDAFQVCDLADRSGLKYKKVGRHYGQNRFMKIFGLRSEERRVGKEVG